MKPVHIEFVRPARSLRLWLPPVLLTMVIGLTGMAVRTYSLTNATDAIAAQTIDLKLRMQTQLAETKKAEALTATDRQFANLRAAANVLRIDWNIVFSTIERTNESGIRLLGLNVEAGSQNVRLEYEVESMVHAAKLTSMLNDGYESAPWKLESVVSSASARLRQKGEGGMMQATWTVTLEKLR